MIDSLDDAWQWYESVQILTRTTAKLGEKHWDHLPWESSLGKEEQFKQLRASELVELSNTVVNELDDLCVLLLFSVFESAVRHKVLEKVDEELIEFQLSALRQAVRNLKEEIQYGSFFKVLESYKIIAANLIEEVNQVRRYRNWVAHGRRGEQPSSVEPKTAFDRLNRFLNELDS